MADNVHLYGFRPVISNTGPCIKPIESYIASAQADQDDTSTYYCHLGVGDPVTRVGTGGVALANAGEDPWGVIVGVTQYYDAAAGVMRSGPYVPYGTTWGTVESRRSKVLVVPVDWCLFEVDVDDKVTATTYAAYHAFIGENVPHTCLPGVTGRAQPLLDISLHATTNTLEWRIIDVSKTKYNRDFSGSYVKLIVAAQVSQWAGAVASGSGAAGV